MVDVVDIHLIDDLLRVLQRFRQVGEDSRHLFGRLEPLLFGIVHSVDVVDEVVGTQTDQSVMRLRVFFVHEVRVVGRNDLHAVFAGKFHKHRVHLFLPLVSVLITSGFLRLMAL